MNIASKDLNLLVLFKVLWEERSVTGAAKRLGLSQPATSNALARLRDQFEDPLFVRVARGLVPTPVAESLAHRVVGLISEAERLFQAGEAFDPRQIEQRFVISGTDYYGQILLPALLPWLRTHAPGVTLVGRSLQGRFPKEELEKGICDLAIAGFFQNIPDGFYQQALFRETYMCVVRAGHPVLQKGLTLDSFCELEHVLISPQGDLNGIVDIKLAQMGRRRKVVCGVDNFFTPGLLVARSDLIMTAPKRLVEHCQQQFNLEVIAPPIEVSGFTVMQVWHERTHADPAHRWLRGLVSQFSQS